MTTAELVEHLRREDPEGNREVNVESAVLTFHDITGLTVYPTEINLTTYDKQAAIDRALLEGNPLR